MVMHQAKLRTPWYADSGDGTLLHRYMDDNFIESFLREATQKKLTANRHQSWMQEDKFGTNKLRLRLPIHRTFYVATTEVVCDLLGQPAFSPSKIISAGFVIRKRVGNSFHIWQVKDGVALGWQTPEAILLDKEPDQYRRLINKKVIEPRSIAQSYSGEQTYPMHTVPVVSDIPGRANHTLLYGFVPLSGAVGGVAVASADNASNNNTKTAAISAAGYLAELEWPFGSWDGVTATATCNCEGNLQEIIQKVCDEFKWTGETGLQVDHSQPSRAFAYWLNMLVSRYQLFDDAVSDNATLVNLLKNIHFYQHLSIANQGHSPSDYQLTQQNQSLFTYLQTHYDDISHWFSDQEKLHRDANLNLAPAIWNPLPGNPGHLYLTQLDAEKIREAMLLRAEAANNKIEASLPFPRYTQGEKDLYFICPFVRYLDDCGCEKIQWGEESIDFKVASPLDPQATRPSVIQLPELSEIKKGMANGVTFLTPKSISDVMSQIVPTLDFKTKPKSSPLEACLGFSVSFSIPIITICAMILLMMVLNLLNIIFRWIPYAILVLPRLCKK